MARTPITELRPVLPPALLFAGEAPVDALFFDTNAALHRVTGAAYNAGRMLLISSLVYAELLRKDPSSSGIESIDALLGSKGIAIVPFDAASARYFVDICAKIEPWLRQWAKGGEPPAPT